MVCGQVSFVDPQSKHEHEQLHIVWRAQSTRHLPQDVFEAPLSVSVALSASSRGNVVALCVSAVQQWRARAAAMAACLVDCHSYSSPCFLELKYVLLPHHATAQDVADQTMFVWFGKGTDLGSIYFAAFTFSVAAVILSPVQRMAHPVLSPLHLTRF